MSIYVDDDYPTLVVKEAVNELLRRNEYTRGAAVGELYLGRRVLVAHLVHTVVIEGHCIDVTRTVDIDDLIDEFQRGQ